MIRINLLAGERRSSTEKAASRPFQPGQKIAALGVVLLVVTALGLGWRYWMLGETEAGLTRQIASATTEEQRLAAILTEVRDFERRRTLLQQRIALIDELRRGQTAPVHIIDQISRAVPEMMWLTSVKQVGYDVTIEGQCLTLTALSDFVGNLAGSRYFRRPVEIVDSKVESGGREGAPDVIGFTVKGTFQMSGIQLPPVEQPARAGAAKKGGKRG